MSLFDLSINSMFFFFLAAHLLAREEMLHMFALNVGFGNFIIVSLGNKSAIFDAGSGEMRFTLNRDIGISVKHLEVQNAKKILDGQQIVFACVSHLHPGNVNMLYPLLLLHCDYNNDLVDKIPIFVGGAMSDLLSPDYKFSKPMKMSRNSIINGARSNTYFSHGPGNTNLTDEAIKNRQKFEKMMSDAFDGAITFKVLIPIQGKRGSTKYNSFEHDSRNMMVALYYGNKFIVLPGDATERNYQNMFEADYKANLTVFDVKKKSCEIFVLPAQGSWHHNIPGLIDHLRPRTVIISADANMKECTRLCLPSSITIRHINDLEEVREHPLQCQGCNFTETTKPIFATGDTSFRFGNTTIRGVAKRFHPYKTTKVTGPKRIDL